MGASIFGDGPQGAPVSVFAPLVFYTSPQCCSFERSSISQAMQETGGLQAHWRPGLILFSPELPNRMQLADIAAQSGYDCFIRMEAASEQATQVYQQNWGQFNLPNAHTLSVNSPS
ncbi:hypothetical protein M0R45_025789 [Rubus argutus]|uniref:Uncharacterized protein n=1 Tax=Rubus argutus TaxID=59490 RepID=A0AAW1WZ96_RUBAR